MTNRHIARPPLERLALARETDVLAAARLVRDAAAVRERLMHPCTEGLYAGAADRYLAAALRLEASR